MFLKLMMIYVCFFMIVQSAPAFLTGKPWIGDSQLPDAPSEEEDDEYLEIPSFLDARPLFDDAEEKKKKEDAKSEIKGYQYSNPSRVRSRKPRMGVETEPEVPHMYEDKRDWKRKKEPRNMDDLEEILPQHIKEKKVFVPAHLKKWHKPKNCRSWIKCIKEKAEEENYEVMECMVNFPFSVFHYSNSYFSNERKKMGSIDTPLVFVGFGMD